MAQNYLKDCFDEDNNGLSDLQVIENNFECLRSMFSGSTAPTVSGAGQVWFDTVTKGLRIRNNSDTTWMCVFHTEATTKIWMYANTAEDGWIIDATVTDRLIAIKTTTGLSSYKTDGGNEAGTWTQPGHVLSVDELPAHDHGSDGAHTHTVKNSTGGSGEYVMYEATSVGKYENVSAIISAGTHTHDSVGAGASHNHGGSEYRPQAAVGIRVYMAGLI